MSLVLELKQNADFHNSYEYIKQQLISLLQTSSHNGYYELTTDMLPLLDSLPLDVKNKYINDLIKDLSNEGLWVHRPNLFVLNIKWK